MIVLFEIWFKSLFKKNAVFIFATHERIHRIQNGKITSVNIDDFILTAKYIENNFTGNRLTRMNKITLFIGKNFLNQINKKIKNND